MKTRTAGGLRLARRTALALGAALGLAAAAPVWGQGEALGDLTLIVPSSPGGGFDITAREMQEAMREGGLARSVTVENHPGGGGAIGLGQIVPREGDPGVAMIGGLALVSAAMTTDAPMSLADTTPLARLTSEWQALAVPAEGEIQSVEDLRAAMEADPGAVPIAGGAAGSLDHVTAALVAEALGADPAALNYIPFSGGGEVAVAVMGGQVPVGVSGLSEFQTAAEGGGLRILAVLADEPVEGVEAPTLREEGVDLSVGNWRSVHGAPGLSEEDRDRLVESLRAMTETPEWQDALATQGWTGAFLAGEEFASYVEQERERTRETLRAIGLLE